MIFSVAFLGDDAIIGSHVENSNENNQVNLVDAGSAYFFEAGQEMTTTRVPSDNEDKDTIYLYPIPAPESMPFPMHLENTNGGIYF